MMIAARYTKADVDLHREYGRRSHPAVNVKMRVWPEDIKLPLDLGSTSDDGGRTWQHHQTNPHFTHDWVREHVSDEAIENYTNWARESGWEALDDDAKNIFGSHVEVYSEGRSGGWAVVHGLKDFDSWDAIDLAKWRKFEKIAQAEADDIARQVIQSIYDNEFEEWVTA